MKTLEERMIDLEIIIANQDRTIDDLNSEILRQGKDIDQLRTDIIRITEDHSHRSFESFDQKPPHY